MKGSYDIIISVYEVFLFISESYLGAAVFGEENNVSFLDEAWSKCSVFEVSAWSSGDDSTEVKLLLLVFRKENATLGLGNWFSLLNEDSVHKWSELLEGDHGVF